MDTLSTIEMPLQGASFLDGLPMDDGVDTRVLRPGDTVAIHTLNSVYRLRLDEPGRGRGVATGNGEFINEEAHASIIGATLTGRGSMVKVGWVLLGFKVVLSVPGGELLTSKVRGIEVNGKSLVPAAAGTH
jgi:hypothetical protein